MPAVLTETDRHRAKDQVNTDARNTARSSVRTRAYIRGTDIFANVRAKKMRVMLPKLSPNLFPSRIPVAQDTEAQGG